MFSNRIDSFTSAKDDKLKAQTNQSFDFEGEGFSSMLEKDEKLSGKLRETEIELLEDESILSTDAENRAIAKRNTEAKNKAISEQQSQLKPEQDERNLLKLMELNTQANLSSIKINKSKKELENNLNIINPHEELEDVISKIKDHSPSEELETLIDMNFNKEKTDKEKRNNQTLHETQEELLEDLSILSTDEENLAMARKAQEYKALEDSDFSNNGEADMELLSEITSINNQANIKAPNSNNIEEAEFILSKVIQESKNNIVRLSLKDMTSNDVNYIIDLLKSGSADSHLNDDENAYGLSAKFLAALKDSLLNKKVFRIDFDNEISIIIKIDVEGKISANFLTSNKEIEEGLKNNLYILQQRFEEQNIKYGTLEYTSTDSVSEIDLSKIEEIIQNSTITKEETTH